jgi:hypothetical protein
MQPDYVGKPEDLYLSQWDEAHKAPVTRMAIFQPGIFYLENY